MSRAASMLALIAVASVVVASGCTVVAATPTPAPTPTPTSAPTSTPAIAPAIVPTAALTPAPPMISGTLTPGNGTSPVAGRHIVLCQLQTVGSLPCTLTSLATVSDSAGHFEFTTVPDGSYLVFYDSGWDDFSAGVTKWTGKMIHVGDVQWLIDNYFTTNPTGGVNVMFPTGAKVDTELGLYRFLGEGPFFWAHTCAADNCNSDAAVLPVQYDVTAHASMDKTFAVYYHAAG